MPRNSILRPWLSVMMILTAITPMAGCRICQDCGDQDYAAYGGAWQRTVREKGRVASLFDPAGGRSSNLSSRDEPTDINQLQRRDDGNSISDQAEEDEARRLEDEDGQDRPEESNDSDEMPSLEDIEDDRSRGLRDLELDDIEVRVLPRGDVDIY